jgi:predicted GNAT superfamily acetyltransferase
MIRIRACEGSDELDACVQHQIETWGYEETDIIPRKTFLLAQKIGGQVIGAFHSEPPPGQPSDQPPRQPSDQPSGQPSDPAESLVGFAMSLPGIKTGPAGPRPYLHSHMLAVREAFRNRGLGAQLKREQRREALARGIRHMEWTFDPLEIKNAFLNIHRLGAIVRAYRPDFYGVSSSRLQGGLPTDRLLAEWELDSPRVQAILDGRTADPEVIEERILVPAAIYQWKANQADRGRALGLQLEHRRKFQQAFNQGLAVLGFSRDAEGNGVFELGLLSQADQVF